MDRKGLFFGLNTVDIHFYVDKYPEVNTKSKSDKNGVYVGGPASNAAVAFAHLGGDTTLISPVGRHHFTQYILSEMSALNVRLVDPISDTEGSPVYASIVTDSSGDRTVFCNSPTLSLSALAPDVMAKIEATDIVLLDGFYMETAIQIARAAQELNKTVVLDGGSWKPGMVSLLKYIDIIICSGDFKTPESETADDIFDYLKSKGITQAAISNGGSPTLYRDNGEKGSVLVKSVDVVDTLGAGDFLHGAFCYYYLQSNRFADALDKATDVASQSCTAFGTRQWLNLDN